ncbi:MAG TPA: ELM1/GtrOC1 family putative glycosyltransferase [Candidatus Binatia bacterium]|nr:ELM1/GtrOC1 family putative glycosyltransferase [Candidatus Binatia bacterium]
MTADRATAAVESMPTPRPLTLQSAVPLVWLVLSDKGGDNAQAEAVAADLPWPSIAKRIAVKPEFALGKPKVEASLHHVDRARSDPLEGPWPDLIVAIGRRMSMVALWIQEQSGGKSKIALLGAPKGMIERFDLAVVSEQYRYPPRANTLRVRYPLQRIDRAAIAAETEVWRAEFAASPRPLIAVMIGGATKEVRFDRGTAERLGRDLGALAERLAGTLFVTTSRRTPAEVVAALKRELPAGTQMHEWRANDTRNPYRALLGLADLFVVTSDSLSMQMEVARLGRPLAIYRLPPGSWLAAGPLSALVDGLFGWKALERRLGALLDRLGALRHHRDLMAVPRRLVADGHAVWFGDPFPTDAPAPPDEVAEVVARIVALFKP